MRFVDRFTNVQMRYSLGQELETRQFYLSIPVSNARADYEEYYAITAEEFSAYPGNAAHLAELADRCRRRLVDARLLVQPGSDRGTG